MDQIAFHGPGLHSGHICGVTLTRAPGPLCFVSVGEEYTREQVHIVRADHGVQLSVGGRGKLDLVEHLCGALGGLGIHTGIRIHTEGPEIPILDGGALEFALALRALGPPRSRPQLEVVQAGEVLVGRSRYSFEPRDSVELSVEVEFPGLPAEQARWGGGAQEFMSSIAPARTFGFRSSARALHDIGRANYVDPKTVIVLEDDGSVLPPGKPPEHTELARHKLLDLIGDLWLCGGPPIGRIATWRPGHQATHQAVKQALSLGLLVHRSTAPARR